MDKYCFSILLAALAAGNTYGAETIDINFAQGIPADVKLYDLDRNMPDSDLPPAGFKPGVAWVTYDIEGNNKPVACSTSWYNPPGQSDDWMVLPELTVEKGTELRWRARAFDMNIPDGYTVYVSTKGDNPKDFDTTTPLFTIDEEEANWTDRTVSLEDYVGKTVNIAFVNDSYDCSMLLISGIHAGSPRALDFILTSPCIGKAGDCFDMSFNVTTELREAVKGVKAGYSYAGRSAEWSFDDTVVTPGETAVLEFPGSSVSLDDNSAKDVTVWMEHGDYRAEKHLTFGAFPRRMVAEEATGTWCQFCPSGAVMMEHMKATYPDHFVGIAVHGDDPMEIPEYELFTTGYPQVFLNREVVQIIPQDVEPYMESYLNAVPKGMVWGEYKVEDGVVTLKAETLISQPEPDSKYNIAVVVTENDVNVPGDPEYDQKNAYAGGKNGPMGGYENLPPIIRAKDMWYQDVARCILDGKNGIPGSVPDAMKSGEISVFDHTFSLPDNVLVADNVEVKLMLIDRKSQKIVNGCKAVKLPSTGIDEISGSAGAKAFASLADGLLTVSSEAPLKSVEAWSADGILLGRTDNAGGEPQAALAIGGYNGIVIWKAVTEAGVAIGKIR